MKVIVTGSRGWKDVAVIRHSLLKYKASAEAQGDTLTVIHGHCKSGADRIADRLCTELGIEVRRVPADWTRYGKAAGPIRNGQMLEKYDPDYVLAFRAAGKSNGTDDMIDKAIEAGVFTIVRHEGDTQGRLANIRAINNA